MYHAETLHVPPSSVPPVRPPGEGSFLTLQDFDAKAHKAGLGLGGIWWHLVATVICSVPLPIVEARMD
jgi:hypothetical protein